jgi:hypothetical protein
VGFFLDLLNSVFSGRRPFRSMLTRQRHQSVLPTLITRTPSIDRRFDVRFEEFPREVRFNLEKERPGNHWIIIYRGDGIRPDGTAINLEVVNFRQLTDDITRTVVIKKPTTRFITITSFDDMQRTPRREFGPSFVGWNVPISVREFQLELGSNGFVT